MTAWKTVPSAIHPGTATTLMDKDKGKRVQQEQQFYQPLKSSLNRLVQLCLGRLSFPTKLPQHLY